MHKKYLIFCIFSCILLLLIACNIKLKSVGQVIISSGSASSYCNPAARSEDRCCACTVFGEGGATEGDSCLQCIAQTLKTRKADTRWPSPKNNPLLPDTLCGVAEDCYPGPQFDAVEGSDCKNKQSYNDCKFCSGPDTSNPFIKSKWDKSVKACSAATSGTITNFHSFDLSIPLCDWCKYNACSTVSCGATCKTKFFNCQTLKEGEARQAIDCYDSGLAIKKCNQ